MLKKSVLAAVLVIGSLFGSMPAAEAKTNVFIGIGGPLVVPIGPGYGGSCYSRGYRYCRPGNYYHGGYPRQYYGYYPRQYYGAYPGYYYGGYPYYYAPRRAIHPRVIYAQPRSAYRLSCGQAKIKLLNRGWRLDGTRDCNGSVYSFTGWQGGKRYLVNVNASNGRVVSRRRF